MLTHTPQPFLRSVFSSRCLARSFGTLNSASSIPIHSTTVTTVTTITPSKGSRWLSRGYKSNYYNNKNKNTGTKRIEPKPLDFVIPTYISVNKLANLINCRVDTLLRDLKRLGFSEVTSTYILSKEYVELILQEYNYILPQLSTETTLKNIYDPLKSKIDPKLLHKRPPIVTIMGHVDHGKTTIIDYLRKSSIISHEHGGITQHIGAFKVVTPHSKKKITFLDTPGHAAFLKMRERGANITDIIVLVVAIEDSIKPQTLEAIKHIKNSGNELIVAITKIDKISRPHDRERALEKVTNDLINQNIMVEKIGGDVQVIPISAKTGENMDLLEEAIIALSDLMNTQAESSPKTLAEGWIIESNVKKTIGNAATVLVKKGNLKRGEILLCGNVYCKIKNLMDETGKSIASASPSDPIEVTGWKDLPHVGDEVIQVKNESIAKKSISKRENFIKIGKSMTTVDKMNEQNSLSTKLKEKEEEEAASRRNKFDEDDLKDTNTHEEGPKKVNFIIKADVSGSAEAIDESIASLGNEEVVCDVISSSVGIPTDSDLKVASVTNSKILCFNLPNLPNNVLNNRLGVEIKQYNVIYKLIEDVTRILIDNLTPIFEKSFLAKAEIKGVFDFTLPKKKIKIAGCKVNNGVMKRNSLIQIVRGPNDEIIYEGKISTLKHGKDAVSEVSKGHECGITFGNSFEGFEVDDRILVYENVKVPRHL